MQGPIHFQIWICTWSRESSQVIPNQILLFFSKCVQVTGFVNVDLLLRRNYLTAFAPE